MRSGTRDSPSRETAPYSTRSRTRSLRYGRDGTYLDARPDADTSQLFAPDEFIGRNVRDVLPDELARTVLACIERALESGSMQVIEYELELGGVVHWREARIVPSGDGEVVAITRDFTEQRRTEAEQRRLAAEQAALRRVATLGRGNALPNKSSRRLRRRSAGCSARGPPCFTASKTRECRPSSASSAS